MADKPSFTGRTRHHKTHPSVRFAEIVSWLCITIGGIGTILAVATVCIFLVWVVVPLFLGATTHGPIQAAPAWKEERPLLTGVDEYQLLGWALFKDGTLGVLRLDNGVLLKRWAPKQLYKASPLTACSAPSRSSENVLGFGDGTVQFATIGFAGEEVEASKLTAEMKRMKVGDAVAFLGQEENSEQEVGLVRRVNQERFRLQKVKLGFEEPIKPEAASPVRLIDLSVQLSGTIVSSLTADGKLRTNSVTRQKNELTGEITRELSSGAITLPLGEGKTWPSWLAVTGVGDNVFVIWEDGRLVRVSTFDIEKPRVVEELELLDQAGTRVTAVQFQIGKGTLLVGDSTGRIGAWFRVNSKEARTADGSTMVAAHDFPGQGAAVTSLAASSRTRLMAAGYADGRVRLLYVTSEKDLADLTTRQDQPVTTLMLAPKDNGLIAQGPTGMWIWQLQPGHPEVTLAALFFPVWYEGYERPEHVWQSTGGDDAVEPKFGLWPLVFGTLKATFYSLILGVPLALLAAVYTSEFLHPRARAVVKPSIEMMASLPSVVLGFLAALVLAPFVERLLPAVLACFLTVPVAFLLGAYLWQLLPEKLSLRLERWRFLYLCIVLPLGFFAATFVGPILERLLFAGNLKGWLDGQNKASWPGSFLLLLPLCALSTWYLMGQFINPLFRQWTLGWDHRAIGLADLGKFVTAAGITLGQALLAALLLDVLGFDPRGHLVGTYVQRNALVVGFMMGFAIIPIIYTIAEDALSLVPEHLRSASLGCGATPWQTALRVIIPTAMSGLFSAVMIGLGRAVGETMIVLMAAGNTPVLDMNIFNGFRTLSANIAVELPEAVRDSTHYRTLFLAALTLFFMTFVLNTVAELVRLRFRRRAFQL